MGVALHYAGDSFFFFFQAEDGIRDLTVTGVQTCALPISRHRLLCRLPDGRPRVSPPAGHAAAPCDLSRLQRVHGGPVPRTRRPHHPGGDHPDVHAGGGHPDRKSTRLNSSHSQISYAVFCSKKNNPYRIQQREPRFHHVRPTCNIAISSPPTPFATTDHRQNPTCSAIPALLISTPAQSRAPH